MYFKVPFLVQSSNYTGKGHELIIIFRSLFRYFFFGRKTNGALLCPLLSVKVTDEVQKISYRFLLAFIIFFASNLGLTLFASTITAFIAPAATGSGIPEVKAYLNGVDAPGIYTLRTLLVKVYTVFSVFEIWFHSVTPFVICID